MTAAFPSRLAACLQTGGASCAVGPLEGVGLVALVLVAAWALRWAVGRLATLRATSFTPTLARRLSVWVRALDYSEDQFLRADGAGEPWVSRRRDALHRLAATFRTSRPAAAAWGRRVGEYFSDLRFTDANRVPFPFAKVMREQFDLTGVVESSHGPYLRDIDGADSLDVSGWYGVNVAGVDRYKAWIAAGAERVKDLGPVLGPLHPLVAENIAMLRAVSGLDDVSFHMSGTEAVMAAVRLARFNTRRRLIVVFSGAYHGWWDGVTAGLGSERALGDCLVLKDLNPASLSVIRHRATEIAAVLVNPVQSFHPNSPPPNDAVLLTSEVRHTEDSTESYGAWLRQLRNVCTACDVPLVFDEVYSGFRLAPGGGQEYFDVRADMVVYGKTLGGGLPIGAVCGRRWLMRRFDPARPMRLAYVVGTFSAHPYVMGAMHEFLRWVSGPDVRERYDDLNRHCAAWVRTTNRRLVDRDLPLRVVHLGSIWTVLFRAPGRFNWLLQYYLRARGVALSWVGTGRCLISMDFTEADYRRLQEAVVRAAEDMQRDGWWVPPTEWPDREKRMRSKLIAEVVGSLAQVPQPVQAFYAEVMRRKSDDHHASHSDRMNQLLHLLSSSVFIYCYVIIFSDLTVAMCLGLASLFVRQFGHAVLEPPCHDKEETLLGYNTRNKTLIVLGYVLIPLVHALRASTWSFSATADAMPLVAEQWFVWTVLVVGGRVAYLVWKYDVRTSLVWYAKLVTDPLTDIYAYFPRRAQRA